MANFAEIGTDGCTVLRVIRLENDIVGDSDLPESEHLGQIFIADELGFSGTWLQTSFSGSFRGKYAGIGDRYDAETDTFVSPTVEPAEEPAP